MEECQVFKQSMTLAVTIFNVNTIYGVHISYDGKGTDLVIKDNLTKFILIDITVILYKIFHHPYYKK